jgi:ribosomal-protein-alanine N-acetyltransferase
MSIDSVFQAFPQLETENLVLRKMQLTDAESVFRVLADEEVTRFYDDDAFADVSQASKQIKAWANGFRGKRCIRWGIARREDNIIIGSCGYYGFHTWHMRASLGYELARSFWRQGIMTEALSAVIDFGFKEMGLNRLQATTMPGNHASVKLLEKLGFHKEGILREYENWGSRGYVDLFTFSLLRREYASQDRDRKSAT